MIVRRIPSGDLALTETGDVQRISGSAQVRQSIICRLRFFKGEWFRNLREGMPYYQQILVANPNIELARSIFRKAILGTPNVLSLSSLELTRDTVNRTLSVEFKARTTEGDVAVTNSGNAPFVIDLA
jgi:hypothetical protein